MLNISDNHISAAIDKKRYQALRTTENKRSHKVLKRLLWGFLILLLIVGFLPWTQNIQSAGSVTALRPDQRPQTIHTVIAGQIEAWYVQEGALVKKGDTIIKLSETKVDYFDPNLVDRTLEQVELKSSGVDTYDDKIIALQNQIVALTKTRDLKTRQAEIKIRQAKLKVNSDSIDYEASYANYKVAFDQYERIEKLFEQDLKSQTELENRSIALQKATSAWISAENDLLASKSELLNAQVELVSIGAQYQYEIAKAESDMNSAIGMKLEAQSDLTKFQNQAANYEIRNQFYYITAPQDGYITKAIKTGLGETVKEGDALVSIMPAKYDLAIEMYVSPIDLPLVKKGQHVRIRFDGWPAIVFSGWPNSSTGTYGGLVYAIDNFISENGKYRVLVIPDPKEEPWPEALRVGSGTQTMLLLNDVPVWYELWRQINGFPPDFYQKESKSPSQSTK